MPDQSNSVLESDAVDRIARKVDLDQLFEQLGGMDESTLNRLAATGSTAPPRRAADAYEPPAVDLDFYDVFKDALTDEQKAIRQTVRTFMEDEVRPVINAYWDRGEFPREMIAKFGDLYADTIGVGNYTFPARDPVLSGVIGIEMSRVDPSLCTFYGVHTGLCMGSIYMFGSDEQKERWIPAMERFEAIGSWALTEPDHGSDASQGLETTAERDGDTWIINGAKKWSGNATIAAVNCIWARDVEDGNVKGFLVEQDTPGYHVEKLGGKIAKRAVENVLIDLDDCRVPDANRLPKANQFRDVGAQLAPCRAGVAWEACGIAMGAYEATLRYTTNRIQFGRPIAGFQMVQDGLVKMLGHVTALQAFVLKLGQLEAEQGYISHERASLAKVWCCDRMREVVAIARGLLGGNGILVDYDVARLFADAEAVYSYEGTREMNTLIVGKAITGLSAFA